MSVNAEVGGRRRPKRCHSIKADTNFFFSIRFRFLVAIGSAIVSSDKKAKLGFRQTIWGHFFAPAVVGVVFAAVAAVVVVFAVVVLVVVVVTGVVVAAVVVFSFSKKKFFSPNRFYLERNRIETHLTNKLGHFSLVETSKRKRLRICDAD